MDIDEYQQRVIELFKSGKATDKQWREMACAVLNAYETTLDSTIAIDSSVDPSPPTTRTGRDENKQGTS